MPPFFEYMMGRKINQSDIKDAILRHQRLAQVTNRWKFPMIIHIAVVFICKRSIFSKGHAVFGRLFVLFKVFAFINAQKKAGSTSAISRLDICLSQATR